MEDLKVGGTFIGVQVEKVSKLNLYLPKSSMHETLIYFKIVLLAFNNLIPENFALVEAEPSYSFPYSLRPQILTLRGICTLGKKEKKLEVARSG